MENKAKLSVILPCYNPDEKLEKFISFLEENGIDDIILINDGSDKDTLRFFPDLEVHKSCTVLVHEKNKGKGAALKTAFEYFRDNRTDKDGVVTADCDGQHTAHDVIRLGEDMVNGKPHIVIGARDFDLPGVPPRSRKGNKLTSLVFRLFVGMKISDTQTGLRAIPKEFIPVMLTVAGDRYEYETNMLLKMKENCIPFTEVKIATVYIEENKTSHFRPVRDSVRIYKLIFGRFLLYLISSLICLAVEEILQVLLFKSVSIQITTGLVFLTAFLNELVDFMPARVLSSVLNFTLNKFVVFRGKSKGNSFKKYYILWFVQAIVTALITTVFRIALNITSGFVYVVVTSLIKLIIFFISYKIQKV